MKTNHNEGCGPFSGRTSWASYFLGPPLFSLPQSSVKCKSTAHIPLERGGAAAAAVHSAHPGVLVIEPTSLKRGEGLTDGLYRAAEGEIGGKGKGGGSGMCGGQAKLNCDGVDV